MGKKVFLDNFTLQGAYSYLYEGKRGRVFEQCISTLVEAVIFYDETLVSESAVCRSDASLEVCQSFGDLIQIINPAKFGIQLSGYEYDLNTIKLKRSVYDGVINPFETYKKEYESLIYINNLKLHASIKDKVKINNIKDFSIRHTAHTLHCIRLANLLKASYVPNPTRTFFVENKEINRDFIYDNILTNIITDLSKTREIREKKVEEYFKIQYYYQPIPLVLNHVLKVSKNKTNLIPEITNDLKNSKYSKAFRKWLSKLERKIIEKDNEYILSEQRRLQSKMESWASNIDTPLSKTIKVKLYLVDFNVDMPIPDTFQNQVTLFLHNLLR